MTNSRLEIQLDKSNWTPGERITGTVHAMLDSPLPVHRIDVSFKGKLRVFSHVYNAHASQPCTNSSQCGNKSFDVQPELQTNNLKAIDTKINTCPPRNTTDFSPAAGKCNNNLNCPPREDANNSVKDRSNKSRSALQKTNVELHNGHYRKSPFDFAVSFVEVVDSLAIGGVLPPGASSIPFEIEPRLSGSNFIASGSLFSPDRAKEVSVCYSVKATVYYPASYYIPFLSNTNLKWTAEKPIETMCNMNTYAKEPPQETQVPFRVGYWDKSSRGIKQQAMYLVGIDTAINWFQMAASLRSPTFVGFNETLSGQKMSEGIQLRIVYSNSQKIQVPPAMEVTSVKIDLHTMIVASRGAYSFSWGPSVSGEVSDSNSKTFKSSIRLLELNNQSIPIKPGSSEIKLDNVSTSMCFPSSKQTMSSCMTPQLQVTHYLSVKLKVRVQAQETDGTSQAIEDVELSNPIRIGMRPPQYSEK